MIKIIPAKDRYFADQGWLKSYFLFSFDRYFEPSNVQWGNLRVFNEDTIAPNSGFPPHPHQDMEIVTIPLDGAISHEDSSSGKGTIGAGKIQIMTAGTGIVHSEMNKGETPSHLYQLWFLPRRHGLAPSYREVDISKKVPKNKLVLVASGKEGLGQALLNADVALFMASTVRETEFRYRTQSKNKSLVYLTSGVLTVNGEKLSPGDQARIGGEEEIVFGAKAKTDFVFIESY